ncbi:lytic murein transglycosylase [Jannaschia sp. W003]|uniref:lytic murein transglycosylase n=1 Tax=Jannaschia sp. W003 TaxID=2867012 RepID=UPI0021A809E8|nr:lytic murein transglycosylase [Jannaschia sp. W003]UWQ22549.1 lytic murein transglycosylase [Jannaschia sp. W003]
MRATLLAAAATLMPLAASAQSCGGDFGAFVDGLRAEAVAAGIPAADADRFFANVRQDPATLRADQRQGVFQLEFTDFARRVISADRIRRGAANAQAYDALFDRIEAEHGVPRGLLLAFWALETDYGQVQGDFDTLNSLVTLAHDCRRPELFRPQVLGALRLWQAGSFQPHQTTGAWAGEIGQVQMLPLDILHLGADGDGDGRVDLKASTPDALLTGARFLREIGWRPNEPWLVEAEVPADHDWSLSGLDEKRSAADWAALGVRPRDGAAVIPVPPGLGAALLAPQGEGGPTFLAFPNFEVLFEWNKSFVYVLTAAYFATRLSGAPVFDAGSPEPGLGPDGMEALQRALVARGHDVGAVDGILGRMTRDAVRAEQRRLGLAPDGWPTEALLRAL